MTQSRSARSSNDAPPLQTKTQAWQSMPSAFVMDGAVVKARMRSASDSIVPSNVFETMGGGILMPMALRFGFLFSLLDMVPNLI